MALAIPWMAVKMMLSGLRVVRIQMMHSLILTQNQSEDLESQYSDGYMTDGAT